LIVNLTLLQGENMFKLLWAVSNVLVNIWYTSLHVYACMFIHKYLSC
jgi:hypothetical protein